MGQVPGLTLGIVAAGAPDLLARSLEQVAPWAGDVVVSVGRMARRSQEMARAAGARLVQRRGPWDAGAALNGLLAAAGGDWVLLLYAGEVLTAADRAHLPTLLAEPEALGYYLFTGTAAGADGPGGAPAYDLRLVRRHPGLRFTGRIHPWPVDPRWRPPAPGIHPAPMAVRGPAVAGTGAGRRRAPEPGAGLPEPVASFWRGQSRLQAGDWSGAAAHLSATVAQLDPGEPLRAYACAGLAVALRRSDGPAAALTMLEQAAVAHRTCPDLWLLLGEARAATGDGYGAAGAFTVAAELGEGPWFYRSHGGNRSGLAALMRLGSLQEQLGNYQRALGAYRQVQAIRPDDTDCLCRLMAAAREAGGPVLRAEVRRLAAGLDTAGLLRLADALLVERAHRPALWVLRAVEGRAGATQDTCLLRGHALAMLGKPGAAAFALERITPRASAYPLALRRRLYLYWAMDDWPQAAGTLRRLQALGQWPPAAARLYPVIHRLLVDGGAVGTLSADPAESAAIGAVLLSVLDTLLACGREDQAGTLTLLLPVLAWPGGYEQAGLLALLHRHHRLAARLLDQALAATPVPAAELMAARALAAAGCGRWDLALAVARPAWRSGALLPRTSAALARRFLAQGQQVLRAAWRRAEHHAEGSGGEAPHERTDPDPVHDCPQRGTLLGTLPAQRGGCGG